MEWAQDFLNALLEIKVADVVDILFVTTLLYAVLALVRRTQAGFVAIGIVMVGVLYIVARAFDLRLTAWIFQGFFAFIIIVVVVVFQEELRQLFERIALWSLRRGDPSVSAADPSDTLIACLNDFAQQRIGALVVLPGSQPVQRQIQGGIELAGHLSTPLLKSIFDPHSPGHDGAVIVENDRVMRFAAHLPLSKDFKQLASVGTRHSAALGLAERTDALCLVVSEERGQISMARDGRLRVLRTPQEVGAIVQKFLREKRPAPDRRQLWGRLFREQRLEKAVVFALVVALWYLFVPGSRTVNRSYDIPVAVHNLPSDLEVESVDPPRVEVTFSGVQRAFYLLREDRLQITIDGTLAKYGRRTFRLAAQNLHYPQNLTLQTLEPDRVKLSLRRRAPESDAGQGDEPATAEEPAPG
jgi:diadenylate cyclase